MSHFCLVFFIREGTTQTCTSPWWFGNYLAQQQMQSTPWCPGQPDLLARLQHKLLEELRAPLREVRMRNRYFHMILLLHKEGFIVISEHQTDGENTFFYCLQKSCLFWDSWTNPGSYRQVSSLKHPSSSCKRSPWSVSNTQRKTIQL